MQRERGCHLDTACGHEQINENHPALAMRLHQLVARTSYVRMHASLVRCRGQERLVEAEAEEEGAAKDEMRMRHMRQLEQVRPPPPARVCKACSRNRASVRRGFRSWSGQRVGTSCLNQRIAAWCVLRVGFVLGALGRQTLAVVLGSTA